MSASYAAKRRYICSGCYNPTTAWTDSKAYQLRLCPLCLLGHRPKDKPAAKREEQPSLFGKEER